MDFEFYEMIPPEEIRDVVKKIFVIDYRKGEVRTDYILPDGTPAFFYMHTNGGFRYQFNDNSKPGVLDDGLYLGYANVSMEIQHRQMRVVGMNIYPIYTSLLFSRSTDEVMNGFASITDPENEGEWLSDAADLSTDEVIAHLKDFIKKRLANNVFSDDFRRIYDKLTGPDGYKTGIEDLASWLGYSSRHMNSLFKKHLGMSPKKFLLLVRFNHALKLMDEAPPGTNLAYIAHKTGYHDQAHFIRDFKRVSGKTPKELIENVDSLANKFRYY